MSASKTKRYRQKPTDAHYVNNREFTLALDEWARECIGKDTLDRPVMPRYVAECVMKMAHRLSLTPRFRSYMYREDMVGNAILAAVKYAHKFDGDRFDNGFAYVTQILFSHMVMTIQKEKKAYKTNLELISQAQLQAFDDDELQNEANDHARAIADQKLGDISEPAMPGEKRGFQLRSGYTKESRAAFAKEKGTPLERDDG